MKSLQAAKVSTQTFVGHPLWFPILLSGLGGSYCLLVLAHPSALLAIVPLLLMACFFKPDISAYLIVLAICATGVFPVASGDLGYGLAYFETLHVTFADLALVLAFFPVALSNILRQRRWIPWSSADTAFLLVLLATALSEGFAVTRIALFPAVLQVIEFWVLWRMIAQSISSWSQVKSFLVFFVALALLELGIGLRQAQGIELNVWGTFASPFLFGLFLGWGAMLAYAQFLGIERKDKWRLAWLGAFALLVAGTLLSGKRSQWFALAVTLLVLTCFRRSKVALAGAAATGVLLLICLNLPVVQRQVERRWEEIFRWEHPGTEAYTRLRLVQVSWQLFTEHPLLGIGPKNFRNVSDFYLTRAETGGYSEVATEQYVAGKLAEEGLLGYAAFLFLMWVLLRGSYRCAQMLAADRAGPIALALFGFFVYITAEAGEWFATERGHVNFTFVGLLIAVQGLVKRRADQLHGPGCGAPRLG